MDANSDDVDLVSAYQSKISKERAGKSLAFDADRQRAVRTEFLDMVNELDVELAANPGPWICGADYTFAHAVWGITLYRVH